MTNFRILILILFIGLNSCNEKNNKVELKEAKPKEKIDYEKYERFWITYEYFNDVQEKIEVYVSKDNDTMFNQIKTLIDGKIDSTKSRFFEFNLKKTEKADTYSGIFKYYSDYDSNLNNIKKTLSLSVF